MSTKLSFFPDEATYRTWIQSMPGISRVMAASDEGAFDEDLDQDTDGPYFVAPGSEWLILRVGLPYCVVRRVLTAGEADFTWYVAQAGQEGEKVYAAYLWDERTTPAHIVAGQTLPAARGALDEYLSSKTLPRPVRQLFTRKLSEGAQVEQ